MRPYEWKAQYYETDQMGVVHHSNYIRWFESARIDFMEQIGISYREMEENGIISPVLTASCEYRKMTYFGERILVEAKVKAYNGIRLVVSYEAREKETGELRACGETSHCFLDRKGGFVSLKKTAPKIHELFSAYGPKP